MKQITCNIIRDILPLYADDLVSPDTRELVDSHLTDCAKCRQFLFSIQAAIVIPIEEDQPLHKRLLKKLRFRKHRKG